MTGEKDTVTFADLKEKNTAEASYTCGAFLSLLWLFGCVFLSLFISPKASVYVSDGLRLCINRVVPSIFPFIIISDIYSAYGHPERINFLSFLFNKVFFINKIGISAYLTGILCGFPLGTRVALQLFEAGCISKDEAERLIAFSSQPSPAFIISAVGASMLHSTRLGLILFISVILSSIICGLFLRKKEDCCFEAGFTEHLPFNPVNSIKSAGASTLSICSFIITFSVVCGLVKDYLPFPFSNFLLLFLEVSTGANYFSSLPFVLTPFLAIAFCLGFGGFSVMLQSKSIIQNSTLSLKNYVPIKILQGLLCAGVALVLFVFFG